MKTNKTINKVLSRINGIILESDTTLSGNDMKALSWLIDEIKEIEAGANEFYTYIEHVGLQKEVDDFMKANSNKNFDYFSDSDWFEGKGIADDFDDALLKEFKQDGYDRRALEDFISAGSRYVSAFDDMEDGLRDRNDFIDAVTDKMPQSITLKSFKKGNDFTRWANDAISKLKRLR